jgi:orotidine-5'-phosphate decarboxylase
MNTLLKNHTRPAADTFFVALDTPTAKEAMALVEALLPLGVAHYKVGMSLFYEAGIPLLDELKAKGCHVFVDLKLHDIPNTVARTTAVLVSAGVSFLNVHTLGGTNMMQAAKVAAEEAAAKTGQTAPTLLGVTILTSHSEDTLQKELGIQNSLPEMVTHLAALANKSGLSGVVCSPQEAALLRANHGSNFVLVTPGIRPLSHSTKDDQSRIATPASALQNGATFLVIGRPIIAATDPVKATEAILQEIETGQSNLNKAPV